MFQGELHLAFSRTPSTVVFFVVDCSLQVFEPKFRVSGRGVSVLASHSGILVFKIHPGDRLP